MCSLYGKQAGLCICDTNFYYSNANCLAQKVNNDPCSSTTECRSDFGLSCQTNLCLCSSNSYWSGTTCGKNREFNFKIKLKKKYIKIPKESKKARLVYCSASEECQTSLGLKCINNICK